MIRSTPKKSTVFSLLLFLLIAYGLGIWSAFSVPSSPFYWYLIPLLCLSTAVVISVKVLWSYRILTINGDRWRVKKLLVGPIVFSGKSIDWWKETEISTANGIFKELHVHTEQGYNVKISLQEHTNYQKIHKKVRSEYPRKQVKEPV